MGVLGQHRGVRRYDGRVSALRAHERPCWMASSSRLRLRLRSLEADLVLLAMGSGSGPGNGRACWTRSEVHRVRGTWPVATSHLGSWCVRSR